jgi:hypothetical protein
MLSPKHNFISHFFIGLDRTEEKIPIPTEFKQYKDSDSNGNQNIDSSDSNMELRGLIP